MIAKQDKGDCCGCWACVNVCPSKCISMSMDREGFLYPEVDKDRCVNCNLCEKVCPMDRPAEKVAPRQVYAVKNKDKDLHHKSTSAGAFTVLAERVIREGGLVFGVRLDENFEARHDYVERVEDLHLFRGSKYLQSRTEDSFLKVKEFLSEGRKVMYTGTPCQVAALRQFLGRNDENLLLVDVVCHGVPSTLAYRKYLKETFTQQKIESVNFRDKRQGWFKWSMVVKTDKQEVSQIKHENPFINGFLSNLYLRPSCHQCQFKDFNTKADITLGDYWGIDNIYPEFYQEDGVGLVIINTDKGEKNFPKECFELQATTTEQAAMYNTALIESVLPHRNRKQFYKRFHKDDFLPLVIRCVRRRWYRVFVGNILKSVGLK